MKDQVFKFSSAGKVLMTLGKRGVAGNGLDTFDQPSGVAVAANGDIFVTDGHGKNDRNLVGRARYLLQKKTTPFM